MAKTPATPTASNTPEESAAKRPWFKKKRFLIPIGIFLLLAIVMPKGNGSSNETSTSAETQVSAEQPAATAEATQSAAAEPEVSSEFKSALRQAETYSDMMHMCQAALFAQLTSQYGGQFSTEAAQYAVDNVKADWNANALAQAIDFQNTMAMSPAQIHDQLTSEYGSQCTTENADFAIENLP